MAEGSVWKYCTCRNTDGRKIGQTCPNLRRPGSAWHPTHGRWAYQLELPPTSNGVRRQLRRRGFDTREDAVAERDQAIALLRLAGGLRCTVAERTDTLSRGRGDDPVMTGVGMGRGRAKAKQAKIARDLKYFSPPTNLTALQRELASAPQTADHDQAHHISERDNGPAR